MKQYNSFIYKTHTRKVRPYWTTYNLTINFWFKTLHFLLDEKGQKYLFFLTNTNFTTTDTISNYYNSEFIQCLP